MKMTGRITIEEAIDVFENSYDSEDQDDDIRTVQFKVKEIKEICGFLHKVRTSQFYNDYRKKRGDTLEGD